MNYQETLHYLFNKLPVYQNIGKIAFKKDLSNIIALCAALGNPQDKFKAIHIAGTNGKGSVSHILTSICMEAGLTTGTYTSPHYRDFRERIRINGKLVNEQFVIDFVATNKGLIEDIQPSFFEITVAMAFTAFADKNVDIAIIETGLGGRLDSTNIITPILSVITNIGLDHMHMLGNTLLEIAMEKAGIIKPGIPVIIGDNENAAVSAVFETKAKKEDATLQYASEFLHVELIDKHLKEMSVSIGGLDVINFPISAHYQLKNIRTAAYSAISLKDELGLSNSHIINGLQNIDVNCQLVGRYQVVQEKPLVILDSAHNEMGISALLDQIIKTAKGKPLTIVFGCVNDKDLSTVLPHLPKQAKIILSKANVLRAMNVEILKDEFLKAGFKHVEAIKEPLDAMELALSTSNSNGIVLACGSIFLIADLLEMFLP